MHAAAHTASRAPASRHRPAKRGLLQGVAAHAPHKWLPAQAQAALTGRRLHTHSPLHTGHLHRQSYGSAPSKRPHGNGRQEPSPCSLHRPYAVGPGGGAAAASGRNMSQSPCPLRRPYAVGPGGGAAAASGGNMLAIFSNTCAAADSPLLWHVQKNAAVQEMPLMAEGPWNCLRDRALLVCAPQV